VLFRSSPMVGWLDRLACDGRKTAVNVPSPSGGRQ
jgi:hypothetical protein